MKNQIKICIFLLLLFLVWSCNESVSPVTLTDKPTDPKVEAYLNRLLSTMEENSINRKTINWKIFKEKVLTEAKGAAEINDVKVDKAISLALTLLQDSHSFFIKANGKYLSRTVSTVSCKDNPPLLPSPDREIGYIKISAFSGTSEAANTFAQSIQNSIKSADNANIKGWIVDLRGNTGGNMWPMIAGVSPILGEGKLGYFIDPDGIADSWVYGNGEIENVFIKSQYNLIKPMPKVALLTDQATASSGEAVVIAFKQRPNTRSFGSATCGLSTSNAAFEQEGAYLYLTVSTMADRKKIKYGTRVVPDVVESNQQIYLKQAVDWLKG